MRLAVIGCGYLGTTHATCLAELGFEVIGVDVDRAKVTTLGAGEAPFFEPDLQPMLRKHVEAGRLTFTTSFEEAADFADVHFLCLGTPQKLDSLGADLTYLESAVESLAPLLSRPSTVIGKSTVPVGTAARLAARIAELSPIGADTDFAWNPEFLREGFAVADTLQPDRLVFGVQSSSSEVTLRRIYGSLINAGTAVLVTDLATAEIAKVACNAFLATKISFINAMAEICEVSGGDVSQLANIMGQDARIGRQFLNAGLGFGGGCLPKDIRAFMHRAYELDVPDALAFLREVDLVNERRRQRVVQLTHETLVGRLSGARIAILGAAFKPNSDDTRDSPALWVAAQLHASGARVTVYDPEAICNARRLYPQLRYADSVHAACTHADVVLHLTEWNEFRQIDPAELGQAVAQRKLIDGRNCLDAAAWRSNGWDYRSLGRL